MGDKGDKKKKKKGTTPQVNLFHDVSGTAMSGDYTGMMPTPADTEEKREAYERIIKR